MAMIKIDAHDRARRLIVGGAHTYSKDDEHFPPNAPRFLAWGHGSTVYGLDDREWLDWGMGLRSVILGYGNVEVQEAAERWIGNGSNFTRPTVVEGHLAERLVAAYTIPDAMVKFGKNGSDATTAAVRLARAYTGRQKILVCDGSFHASDDWWLSTQPLSAGTVEQGTRVFPYNDADILAAALFSSDVAAVIMEPMAFEWPLPGYLEDVRRCCDNTGTLLIFDEMISWPRFGMAGGSGYFGVTPDLATFGKGLGNGFSVSALVGRGEIMTTPGVHLLSSTHGGETHALAAAIATIDELTEKKVPDHLARIGERVRLGFLEAGYDVRGHPASPNVVWPSDKRWPARDFSRGPTAEFFATPAKQDGSERMAFIAAMCDRGILAPYWAPSYSHTKADVDRTIAAARDYARSGR
ncbi:MAG: aminotransferase class III-fold pyridoxal phosphate-dependent enzyme [Betaproteobacteria bacterium]|nr:aminotransferase class III-fold pyridoxal phosphate-dependent enzyme [Betaproteobacteria bacterium]